MEDMTTHEMERQRTACQYVLGACMLDASVIPHVSSVLEPEAFHKMDDKLIFESILEVFNRGDTVTALLVAEELDKNKRIPNELARAGGNIHLVDLMNSVVEVDSIEYICGLVQDRWTKRKLINIGKTFATKAKDTDDVKELLDEYQQELFRLSSETPQSGNLMISDDMSDILKNVVNPESFSGVRSGIAGLDTLIGGFSRGDMVILAARPSMGKSALLVNMMHNICINEGLPTLLFSLEMPRKHIVTRLLSTESNIPYKALATGDVHDYDRLASASARLRQIDFAIVDKPGMKVSTIRSEARRMKGKLPELSCIGIDYVQLIQSAKTYGVREQEVADVARNLKALAIELEVPVIVAAQINRSHEQGTDRRPQMASLRESGELEQTADMVGFLYRDDYYDEQAENEGQTELIIRKNRNGPIGTVYLQFEKNIMTFKDY